MSRFGSNRVEGTGADDSNEARKLDWWESHACSPADRGADPGALALHHVKLDAHSREWRQDVGEEDDSIRPKGPEAATIALSGQSATSGPILPPYTLSILAGANLPVPSSYLPEHETLHSLTASFLIRCGPRARGEGGRPPWLKGELDGDFRGLRAVAEGVLVGVPGQ